MAFSKKRAEDRKRWMNAYQAGTYLDTTGGVVRYDDFVNKELVLFSRADLQRSIPSMMDGLKTSQRKVLFACLKRKLRQDVKVAQLSGYVSEHAAYHHGEQSLASTIVGLAQDYVGSNNVNVLVPSGQFGTRLQGGKDHASPRYVFTRLAPTCRAMFPESDDALLDYLDDDGQSIEPDHYLPVVPFVLINGADGIGTGWSTSIPNHDPRDVIRNVRRALDGEPLVPMRPWYRGFEGTIVPEDESGTRYVVAGRHELDGDKLVVTELPVRTWTADYKAFLESEGAVVSSKSSPKSKPLVADFREHHTDASVRFEITIAPESMDRVRREGVEKAFRLTSRISTTNMHCFDAKGVMTRYASTLEIVEAFVPVRLKAYERRRLALVRAAETEVERLSNRARFVLAVTEGELVVAKKKRDDLVRELRANGYVAFSDSYEYLLGMPVWSLTRERVDALLAERDRTVGELERLRRTTARELWREDLVTLEKALDDADAEYAKENVSSKKRKRCD